MKINRKTAILYMIITAVLWSTGGLLIKLVSLHPMAIAGARSGIAALIMLPLIKIKFKSITKLHILAALAYAATLILFVNANKLTTSANTILLQFTAPIWVAFFSGIFLREKIRLSDWVTILLIFAGLSIFLLENLSGGKMLGNLLALISGFTFASMIVLLKYLQNDSPLSTILIGNILNFLIGIPFYFQTVPSTKSIIGLLMLGVFQVGLAYILYTKAIKHLSAIESILIPVIEPILNPVWVFLIIGETPGIKTLIGGLIVILVLVIRSIYQLKRPLPTTTVEKPIKVA